MLSLHLGRLVLCIILPLFFSSCCIPEDSWEFHHVHGICPLYDSAQVLFARGSVADAVEIELLKGSSGKRMYVNLHFCPIDDADLDIEERTILIKYGWGEKEENESWAYVMGGGQRLLLSEDTTEAIIEALLQGEIVNLTVGLYRAAIPASNFSIVYSRLEKS